MHLSNRQAFVLANVGRVKPLPYKVNVQAPIKRYQLDGVECTPQITGLVVKGLVVECGDRLERVMTKTEDRPARQAASPDVINLIREAVAGGMTPKTGRDRSTSDLLPTAERSNRRSVCCYPHKR